MGPLTLNMKTGTTSHKIIQALQLIILLCLDRNQNAKLYLPSTFQASDIELLIPKLKLNIHLTKSPKCDHIYKLCLYTIEEQKMLNTNILICAKAEAPMLKNDNL